jgi:hypothetical protein
VSAPLKYEFCWSALPPQAGRHWKLTVEGFEIEMATDRITATIESAMDTEDELRGRAENIVDNLARATRFQENIGDTTLLCTTQSHGLTNHGSAE